MICVSNVSCVPKENVLRLSSLGSYPGRRNSQDTRFIITKMKVMLEGLVPHGWWVGREYTHFHVFLPRTSSFMIFSWWMAAKGWMLLLSRALFIIHQATALVILSQVCSYSSHLIREYQRIKISPFLLPVLFGAYIFTHSHLLSILHKNYIAVVKYR